MPSTFLQESSARRPITYQDLFRPGSPGSVYQTLRFPDVEWLTDGADDLHLRPFWAGGFIPFALNGRGDAWCFSPRGSRADDEQSSVALCCHDFNFGQLYAPSFAGWLFRRILDICRGDFGLEEVRLDHWVDVLCPLLPVHWVQTLEAIKRRPAVATLERGRLRQALISEKEYEILVARHLQMPGLDQIFEWRNKHYGPVS